MLSNEMYSYIFANENLAILQYNFTSQAIRVPCFLIKNNDVTGSSDSINFKFSFCF